jgi:hypothetical protein
LSHKPVPMRRKNNRRSFDTLRLKRGLRLLRMTSEGLLFGGVLGFDAALFG